MSFVRSLPIVENKHCLNNMHLDVMGSARYWLPWTDEIGVWLCCDGHTIEIVISEAFTDVEEAKTSLINCMSLVTGACLNLQNCVAIHANAVALAGVAAAFVGHSGRGKSTLTAFCLSHGAGFVTDDVLSIDAVGMVKLGYPRVKLYPHTSESLGIDSEESIYKIHYHPQQLGGAIEKRPLPLGIIYLLEEGSGDYIYSEKLSPSQAVFDLLTHSYYASRFISHNSALLDTYIRLVTQAPVKKLFYPRTIAFLPRVYDFLLEEIHQL